MAGKGYFCTLACNYNGLIEVLMRVRVEYFYGTLSALMAVAKRDEVMLDIKIPQMV